MSTTLLTIINTNFLYFPACEWVCKQLGKLCGLGKEEEEGEGGKDVSGQETQNGYDKQAKRNRQEGRVYRDLERNSYEQYG